MRNKTHRCERCISQEVVRSQTTQTKIETRGNDVFYVGASYLEVDGLPHSHELVDHLHSDDELVRYGGDEFFLLFRVWISYHGQQLQ